jgi:hypothetical protein
MDETMDVDMGVGTSLAVPQAPEPQWPPMNEALPPPQPTGEQAASSSLQPTQSPQMKEFRDLNVKMHVRRPGRDSWTYIGRAIVSHDVSGHSSRVVVRNAATDKVITVFSEGSDIQADKRGNFIVIASVEAAAGGVMSYSLNTVNNSDALRLLASIELASYRCRAVADPKSQNKSRRRIEKVIKDDRRRRHRRRKADDELVMAFGKQSL